jgi:penicillin-binding protein 1A
VRGALLTVTFLAACGFGALYAGWVLVCQNGACPSVESLEGYNPRQTSKLYAADGRFVAEIGNERRTLVKLADIPDVVREAFLVTEDKRFYEHGGVDWLRVPGALLKDLRYRSFKEGFSTITMQLARNVFTEDISRDKTLVRKLREAKVARQIEQRYSKDKILELYLNQIYLGAGAYGVETAAHRYFGKGVKDLNLAEATTLAALPKGPERYNPRRYADRAVRRRNTIIGLMNRAGVVGDADARLAQAYPLQLAGKEESGESAPYFVEWVRQQLEAKFGRQLYEDGLKVYTTLDPAMQSAAERALEAQLRAIEAGRYGPYRHPTFEQYAARGAGDEPATGAQSPYLQGAFVALDPRTGAVRALVGGRDFDDSKFNRATQALRQPGSSFKPIVYSTAVQNGRGPATIVDDDPITLGDWTPKNFDGKFMGPIPMRRALYLSRNAAAVHVGSELGAAAVVGEARRFGITSPIPSYPSIFLGAADVYPLEMVAAYTTFASLGTRATPFAITRVEDRRGAVLWQPAPKREPVLSAEEAYLMVSMMKDVNQHGTAYNAVWNAGFHEPSGGKTGTTNDGADAWYIGYTPDLVAGVWVGMDRPQKIKPNAQGGELAAPAWTAFMTEVYRRRPSPGDWEQPAGVVDRQIVTGTSKLWTPECVGAPVSTEIFIAGAEPTESCVPGESYGAPADSTGANPDTAGLGDLPADVPRAPRPTPPRPTVPRPTVPAPASPLR